MTLPRFFIENQVIADQTEAVFGLRLSDDDFKHARALRLKKGEHISVIDAAQDYFECAIESFDGIDMRVRISAKEELDPLFASVVLVQGLAKGEKMDTIIRQGTEIGVSAFIPFASKRSVVKVEGVKAAKKRERWASIAKSAAMQSAQAAVPEISEILKLDQVCEFISQASVVVICWEEAREAHLRSRLHDALASQGIMPEDARIAVVVGPEGGFEEEEVQALLASNPHAFCLSLGPSILRTETAGVMAPALVLHNLGVLA
ncbi:MAG: RsmE family RNA methyltransferase [Raoultibacter sp.]|jgi:16S rRNA (uracil1498-N3)-methyltransferase